MIVVAYGVSLLLAAVALADQLRRGESTWTAAGRDRGWWTGVTAALGLLGLGVIMALAYLTLVLPRFGRAPGADPEFRKSGAPATPAPPQPPAPSGRDAGGRLVVEFDD